MFRLVSLYNTNAVQTVDPGTGYTFMEKSIEIRRDELENFQGTDPFMCECRAYYKGDGGDSDWQHVDTEKTIVQIACECVLLSVSCRVDNLCVRCLLVCVFE